MRLSKPGSRKAIKHWRGRFRHSPRVESVIGQPGLSCSGQGGRRCKTGITRRAAGVKYRGCLWCGLLRGSFRPNEDVCMLWTLVRNKGNLVAEAGDWLRRIQKSLDPDECTGAPGGIGYRRHHGNGDFTRHRGSRTRSWQAGEISRSALQKSGSPITSRRFSRSAASVSLL